jgi:amino acid transporter
MWLSAILIFILTVFGTLAIAFVIPAEQLDLAAGVMQALQYFFASLNLVWLIAPMAILMTIGGVVLLGAWLIGPALGLGVVAKEGNMPPLFSRTNS